MIQKKSESKKSFSNQRAASDRRGRGRGLSSRPSEHIGGKTENQVYVLHSVKYNNPSVIKAALSDASTANSNTLDKNKKLANKDATKIKKKELFRMYDLHDYAGVVNVDDLPPNSVEA